MTRVVPPSWFSGTGPDPDVVVSSRVRLARNLAGYRFPSTMHEEERLAVAGVVAKSLSDYEPGILGDTFFSSGLSPGIETNLLVERNLVPSEASRIGADAVYLDASEETGILVNYIDHVRLFGIGAGRCLTELNARLDVLDSILDDRLNYAASLDLGHLTAQIQDVGSGVKASVLLHLPGLAADGTLPTNFANLRKMGFQIRGFSHHRESIGDLYLIETGYALEDGGESAQLDDILGELVHYERRARSILLDEKAAEVEDKVARAVGNLTFGRRIGARSALVALAELRLGLCLDLVSGTDLSTVTSLFFLAQKFHILYQAGGSVSETDETGVEQARAKVMSDVLASVEVR